jgi:hypothetical protein
MPAVSSAPSTLTLLIALVGLLIATGQFLLARSQRRIADANSQATQYSAWRSLATEWRWANLVAQGPSYAAFSGLSADDVAEYSSVVERYRDAAVTSYDVYPRDRDSGGFPGDPWSDAVKELRDAEEALERYRRHVEAVLGFLGRAAGLVFRSNISTEAAYNAFGADLVVNRRTIGILTAQSAVNDGHPGTFLPAFDALRNLDLDDVSRRLGWATEYRELPGFLQRIRALTILMVAQAVIVGDIALDGPEQHPEITPDEVRAAYFSTRKTSLWRSVGTVVRLDRAITRSAAERFHYYEWAGSRRLRGIWKGRMYVTWRGLTLPWRLVRMNPRKQHVREGLWMEFEDGAPKL